MATGTEQCLTPNEMPCRPGSTLSATSMLEDVRVRAVPNPATATPAASPSEDMARPAIPRKATR